MSYNNFKNEREYTSLFSKMSRDKGYWFYKIADVWFARKPFDSILRTDKWDYYIEFKVANTNKTSIERLLKPHQITNLTHISKLGGKALVIVWYKKDKATAIFDINNLNKPIQEVKELNQVFYYLP